MALGVQNFCVSRVVFGELGEGVAAKEAEAQPNQPMQQVGREAARLTSLERRDVGIVNESDDIRAPIASAFSAIRAMAAGMMPRPRWLAGV